MLLATMDLDTMDGIVSLLIKQETPTYPPPPKPSEKIAEGKANMANISYTTTAAD